MEKTEKSNIIISSGTTLETRFSVPDGYGRIAAREGSIAEFLRGYKMREDGSPVLLYNGEKKGNQNSHAAVFALPIENADLQQCADSIMRIYAEYYWNKGEKDKIAFHFTDGFLCEYSKWREGYRVIVGEGTTRWEKSASVDDSYEDFVKYLRVVFSYAGTSSMETLETDTISPSDMTVGDVILKGGTPGHVVMVVDQCENTEGKKAYLLAQGYMPAQEFHVINNPKHNEDPWYYEDEILFPLRTVEYTFESKDMIKRLKY
ncbi:MAG: DUF4846 domain-containing protein [Monoglobales bacterium]